MKELNIKPDLVVKIILIALIVPVLMYVADGLLNSGKIHYGVSIYGQQVGGLSAEEAQKQLIAVRRKVESQPAKLKWDEQTWELQPQSIDAKVKLKAAIDEAGEIGFRGNLLDRAGERFAAWRGQHDIGLDIAANKEKMTEFVSRIASDIDKQALNPTVIIKDGKAVPVEGQTGLLLSKAKAVEVIKKAILSADSRPKNLPVLIIPTSISYQSALEASKKANYMMAGPITLKYAESTWTLSSKEIAQVIEFKEEKSGKAKELDARIGAEKAKTRIELLTKGVVREPQDARFSASGERVVIIPSREGISINYEKAVEDFNKVAEKKQTFERELLLTSTTMAPKLTTEKAQSMGIKEKIKSFTTTYNSLARSRVSNIHLLTRSLDGTILAPGETFSFNKTIGPRTASKGYKEAPVILNGKLVPGLGGGVCQVATTVFNAVFFAGLPVNERRNHSFYISKYPTGRDASVSWPSIDLKFKNDTGAHLLIKGSLSSNSVTITLYGTDPERTVKYNTTGFSGITAFPIERVASTELEQGVENIVDVGETGKQVSVYRTVTKGDKILFKDTFTSRYRPKVQVVHFGTKLPVVSPTTSQEQTPL